MIAGLKRRAAKAGLLRQIDARLASSDSMGVDDLAGSIDFTLAFAVVHEMLAPGPFFSEAAKASKPGASVLFVEPAGHVNTEEFQADLQAALQAGFTVMDYPSIRRKHAVLLRKT